jgi:hypothetical protein
MKANAMASRLPRFNGMASWSCAENAEKNCKHEHERTDQDDASLATRQLSVLWRDDVILVRAYTCASQSLIVNLGAV